MIHEPETLRIRTETSPDGHVLRLSGELDLASAGELDTAIAELCTDGARRICLEMADLSFMDSTGLRSVLVGQELCEVNGCALLIGELSSQVRRLFEVSGVGEKLTFRDAAA
ncbi:MAG TPA: STAS domain-containing protein [Solirubrobacteraceae bacterium]|nr:STAS domain-containing protein [Solirubrobacteraceae bacterium]